MVKYAVIAVVVLSVWALPVSAAPKEGKAPGKARASEAETAGDRIANETADAVADVLTGEKAKAEPSKGSLPPGLAKKDKTPPGWDKGKKTGWDKEEAAKEDSPIKKFIKGLFGQK